MCRVCCIIYPTPFSGLHKNEQIRNNGTICIYEFESTNVGQKAEKDKGDSCMIQNFVDYCKDT